MPINLDHTTATFSTTSGPLTIGIDSAVRLPVGNQLQRPLVPVAGHLRFDTTSTIFEGYDGTNWLPFNYSTTTFNTDFATKSTSDLTEGTNLYFTDERVDDRVSNLLIGGTGISLTYDDILGTLTIDSSAGVEVRNEGGLVLSSATSFDFVGVGVSATDQGSLIAAQRQRLAEEAMSVGSHGILWIDSDMTFPSDIYHQLIRREKAIVGAAYSVKDESGDSTAMIDHDGTLERVSAGTGLRRVDACGFGALFTDITVFEQMPRPWFQTTYDYEYEYHNGEDVFFCEQARDRGYDIWVDMDLSKHIGHVGSKDYRL